MRFNSNIAVFHPEGFENERVSGRRLQRLPGTRVEPAPNSEYVPISEMRLITRDYGSHALLSACTYISTGRKYMHAPNNEMHLISNDVDVPQNNKKCTPFGTTAISTP